MQKKPRAGILFLTIMMLWGIIYPQYAFTEEMYETVQSADAADGSDKTAVAAGRDCLRDYRRILTAAPGGGVGALCNRRSDRRVVWRKR